MTHLIHNKIFKDTKKYQTVQTNPTPPSDLKQKNFTHPSTSQEATHHNID